MKIPSLEPLHHKEKPVDQFLQKPDIWCPLLLLLAGILFFSDPLFSSTNFYFRDILSFHYPLRRVLVESYGKGQFPLWNPYIFLGQPMLANPNYMAFYPTNLLHLLFPFDYAFKLHLILHPLLGGLGLFYLQRRLGILPVPALAGSLAYQFSGTVLSFLNLYNIVPAVALLPWLGWSFVCALRSGSWARTFCFGLLLALQAIAMEPIMLQCDILLLGGLAALHVASSEDRRKAVRSCVRVGVVAVIAGLALAAVQILPTLELIPLSARGATGYAMDVHARWSMHPADYLNLFVANLFGTPYTINRSTYWGELYHDGREPYLVSFFLGAVSLLLALFSCLSRRRKLVSIFFVLALAGTFLSLGKFNPVYHWIYQYTPLFSLGRYPSKYFLLSALALAVLISLGLEVLLTPIEGDDPRRRKIIVLGLCGVTVAAVLLGIWAYWAANPQLLEELIRANVTPDRAISKDFQIITSQVRDSLRSSGVFLLLAGATVLISQYWGRMSLLGGLLILFAQAELIPANLRLSPLISGRDVAFVSDLNLLLRQMGQKELSRVVSLDSLRSTSPVMHIPSQNRSWAWFTYFFRMSGQPMYGIMEGIQYSLDKTVDHLNTLEAEELSRVCAGLPDPVAIGLLQRLNSPVVLSLNEISDPRVEHLDSFDALAAQKVNVYRLHESLPRAYFVNGVEQASSHADAMQRFLRSDSAYDRNVILENGPRGERPGQTKAGEARVVNYASGHVVSEVEARVPGYLVLLDSYYPGWRAFVDGREAMILRANYAFRAVEVGAGNHRVEFIYRPRSFYLGLWVSGVALLFAAGSLMWPLLSKMSARIISRGSIDAS